MTHVAALVLPGGTDLSYRRFRRSDPTALRMYPFTFQLNQLPKTVARQAVYQVRGWNGFQASPVAIARNQLNQLADDYPAAHLIVIGHSMGGRVAAHLAADPRVKGVLALAPWWEHHDWKHIHPGAIVQAIHGSADTVTYAYQTSLGISELRKKGVDATYTEISNGNHAMLDHFGFWQHAATRFSQRFAE